MSKISYYTWTIIQFKNKHSYSNLGFENFAYKSHDNSLKRTDWALLNPFSNKLEYLSMPVTHVKYLRSILVTYAELH